MPNPVPLRNVRDVQFVQFSSLRYDPHGWSRVKGTRARATRRTMTRRPLATKRTNAATPNGAEVVRLVQIPSSGLGSEDGVVLGRGIAALLAQAYGNQRLALTAWVKQLATQYGGDALRSEELALLVRAPRDARAA